MWSSAMVMWFRRVSRWSKRVRLVVSGRPHQCLE